LAGAVATALGGFHPGGPLRDLGIVTVAAASVLFIVNSFLIAIVVAVFVTAPREAQAVVTGPVTDDRALTIAAAHCIACHSTKPTNPNFARPPKGVVLETTDELRRHATQIKQQAVLGRAMPLGNVTRMTDMERAELGVWVEGGK